MADIILRNSSVDTQPSSDAVLLGAESANAASPTLFSLRGVIGGAYNVKAYGALGDGSTNDTTAIQAAIDAASAAGGGLVVFPNGTYRCVMVKPKTNVFLWSNGATLKCVANTSDYYRLLDFESGVNNSGTLGHFNIDGDWLNQSNSADENDGQVGVQLQCGCYDLYFQSLRIYNWTVDGILVGYNNSTTPPKNVYFDRVVVDYCRRNGVAVVCAEDVVFNYLEASYIGTTKVGVGPWAGLDIEPDNNTYPVRRFRVVHLHTHNNGGRGVYLYGQLNGTTFTTRDIRIDHIWCHDNDAGGVWMDDLDRVSILGGYIEDNGGDGIYIPYNVRNLVIRDTIIRGHNQHGIHANMFSQALASGRWYFDNVTLDGNGRVDAFGVGLYLGSDSASYKINRVHGRILVGDTQSSPAQNYGSYIGSNVEKTALEVVDLGGNTDGVTAGGTATASMYGAGVMSVIVHGVT